MPPANPNPLFQMVHSDEFQKKRRDGIGNRLFADARTTMELLSEVGEKIALDCGCIKPQSSCIKSRAPWVYYGPLKDRQRAGEKVNGEYGGNWYDLKDVVRMTIIAPSLKQLKDVQNKIPQHCVTQNHMAVIKSTEIFEKVHPCGYSGLIFVVRLANGRPGELQVNTSEIIYGKEKENVARPELGQTYYDIKGRYGIECGRHHVLYEIYRAAPAGAIGKEAAQVSKMYLNYLRGHPHPQLLQQLKKALASIMSKEPSMFRH